MKMDLGTLMNLIVVWMSVLIITLDASQGAELTDDFDFEKDTKSARFSMPTDDDESDDFSGAYLGRFPSFPSIDDEEILVYERTNFDKTPAVVDVFVPDEENDSMYLADIKKLDEGLGPGMLQSNEFDSDSFYPEDVFGDDCAQLEMFGIACDKDAAVGPDEKPTTTTEGILQTTETKATTTPLETSHKQEMKTLQDQSSPTAQDHQPEPTTNPNEIVVTSKESTRTTTKISEMAVTTTTAIKSVDSSAVTSDDTKLVVPEIVPVTDKSEREGHATEVKPKPEVPQGTTAIARDAAPHPTKPETYTKPQTTPNVMTRPMTTKKPNVATQQPTKTAMQSGEDKEQPVHTALPPDDVQATTELEDTAGKEVASTSPPSSEKTTTKKVSDMSKSKVPKTTQVEQQTTDSVESLPTVNKEDKAEPPSAVTSKSKAIPEDTTALKQAAPQQAQFSTIVLVVCIISLLIVLVLVIVIIVIVRARLKKRGKYAITSEVDSAEGAAGVEGGKSDVARGSGEKVVTVQYNDANA